MLGWEDCKISMKVEGLFLGILLERVILILRFERACRLPSPPLDLCMVIFGSLPLYS